MTELEESIITAKDYSKQVNDLIDRYSIDHQPIEVSFRDLVPELNKPDRATHLIHTYPAKLLMHIPHFFLNNSVLSKEGDTIMDPFCGSGTVMLEALLALRHGIGADANPLARLITRVKVHKYKAEDLRSYANAIIENINRNEINIGVPNVINVDYWFLPEIQKQLTSIFNTINNIIDEKIKEFFLVCFSNCVKKVSLADQRVSVPVRLNPERYNYSHPLYLESKRKLENLVDIKVIDKFLEIVNDNIARFQNSADLFDNEYVASVVSDDARKLTEKIGSEDLIKDDVVSLIICSPPYAGAQKYIRASSLNLGWLGLVKNADTLKELDGLNIGRENYKKSDYDVFRPTDITQADILLEKIFEINPLRAHIAGNYLKEMKTALTEAVRVLKPDGYFVLVVGNNQVCGLEFETQEYLRHILEGLGLTIVLRLIDDIQSYGLMTKRNKTANVITREWVLILKK
jgi:DNA modification methylase